MLLRILLLVFLSHCLTGVSYRENKIEKIFSCSINSFSGTDNGVTTQFFSQLVILSVKQHTQYCMIFIGEWTWLHSVCESFLSHFQEKFPIGGHP